MQIISRKDAKAKGLKRYFTGTACKQCGIVGERQVAGGCCLACKAAWKEQHRDAINKQNREYLSRPEVKARMRDYRLRPGYEEKRKRDYQANPEARQKAVLRAKLWAEANPAKAKASARKSRQRAEQKAKRAAYYRLNRDRLLAANAENVRAWAKANPERAAANNRAGQHRRRVVATDRGNFTAADVAEILGRQRYRCAYCKSDLRKRKYHIDHIIPLAKGGTNDRSNIQVTCPACNHRKKDKHPAAFARELGFLI